MFLHIGMFLSLLRIFSLHFHSRSHVIVTAFTFSLLICDFFSAHAHVFLRIPHCYTFAIFYVSPSFSSSSCFFACERFLTTTAHLHVFYFLRTTRLFLRNGTFFSLLHVFSVHFNVFGFVSAHAHVFEFPDVFLTLTNTLFQCIGTFFSLFHVCSAHFHTLSAHVFTAFERFSQCLTYIFSAHLHCL